MKSLNLTYDEYFKCVLTVAQLDLLSKDIGFINKDLFTIWIPLIDIANHNFNTSFTSHRSEVTNIITSKAVKDIKKGEEIAFNYFNQPNNIFMLIFGFTIKDNPNR